MKEAGVGVNPAWVVGANFDMEEAERSNDEVCPCGQHPIEYTDVVIGPHWVGDEPQRVLVCPTPGGKSVVEGASRGYLYVPPGVMADQFNWIPVWAVADD